MVRPVFPASRVHTRILIRTMATPCVADIQAAAAEIRRGRKKKPHSSSYLTHENLIGCISAFSKPIHFWFSPKLSATQGLQSQLQPEAPRSNFEILTSTPWGSPHLTQSGQGRSLPARQPFDHSARTLQTANR